MEYSGFGEDVMVFGWCLFDDGDLVDGDEMVVLQVVQR